MTKRIGLKEKQPLWEFLHKRLEEINHGESDVQLKADLPKKWEKHGDLILLPQNCFTLPEWNTTDQESLWQAVAEYFKVKKVAKKSAITDDGFRTPQVTLLKGSDSWVCHIDNKIKYHYDITRCMFSAGNITEKMRMAKLSCQDEVIVDMFAGIGYFTLPLLVHAKARRVHACEWNKNAIVALKKNLHANKVSDKCTIHEGDNREVCPEGVADRVVMGLIPTPMQSLRAACKALKYDHGGVLHIHRNVESKVKNKDDRHTLLNPSPVPCNKTHVPAEWVVWAHDTVARVNEEMCNVYSKRGRVAHKISTIIVHMERVKSYAPHIDHMVLDVKVSIHDRTVI